MATWTVTSFGQPEYGMGEAYQYPQIKHDFEANYQQTRKQFTRPRHKFDLSWKLMPNSAYGCLKMFVNSNAGGMFGFAHPVTTAVHTCRFGSQLESTIVAPGFWSAKITLEEV